MSVILKNLGQVVDFLLCVMSVRAICGEMTPKRLEELGMSELSVKS